MFVVHFGDGTIFRAGLADSAEEAKEQGWDIEQNAVMYHAGHGFKDRDDFNARVTVTEESKGY